MGEYGRRARGEDFGGGGGKARLQNRQSALRQVGRERAPLRRQRRACARNERRARANLTGESGRWGAPLNSSPVEQHAAAPAAKLPAGCGKVCTPFGTAGGWEGNARYFHTSLACSGLTPASESASASRRCGVVCAGIGVRCRAGRKLGRCSAPARAASSHTEPGDRIRTISGGQLDAFLAVNFELQENAA